MEDKTSRTVYSVRSVGKPRRKCKALHTGRLEILMVCGEELNRLTKEMMLKRRLGANRCLSRDVSLKDLPKESRSKVKRERMDPMKDTWMDR